MTTPEANDWDDLIAQLPAELRPRAVKYFLAQKGLLRELEQNYLAKWAELRGVELFAAFLEFTFCNFDRRAHFMYLLTGYNANPVSMNADSFFPQSLQALIDSSRDFVQSSLRNFKEHQASEVIFELSFKLMAKREACLRLVELRRVNGGNHLGFEAFARALAQSPMKPRAEWWLATPASNLIEALEEGRLALERSARMLGESSCISNKPPNSQAESRASQRNSGTDWIEGACDPELLVNEFPADDLQWASGSPPSRRRGPKTDFETALKVKAVVDDVASNGHWKLHLTSICAKLDELAVRIPKPWRSFDISDWAEAAVIEKQRAIKAIDHHLSNAKKAKGETIA